MRRTVVESFCLYCAYGACLVGLAASCRTSSPDELVYTYQSARPTRPAGAGGTTMLPATGSGGGGGADGTGSTQGAGGDGVAGSFAGGEAGEAGSIPFGDVDAGKSDAASGIADAALVEIETAPELPFTKHNLLDAIATCAMDRNRDFLNYAKSLRDKVRAYAANRSDANARAVQGAWASAMTSWQAAELFRVGPAAATTEPGGKGLRDQIYSWPLVNPCYVDELLVGKAYADASFAATRVNGRGLAAIEYLVFSASPGNTCSNFSTINASGSWNAISLAELSQRRADYAARAADDVVSFATELADAWDPEHGNFRRQLVEAGSGTYKIDQDALNAVSDAMFYLEREVKDLKLGRPIGLYECLNTTCPELAEAPYAHVSVANIRTNLAAFRRLFQGCGPGFSGLGFEDWLRAAGANDLADRMLTALTNADASVAGLTMPIEQSVIANPVQVLKMHAVLKVLTDMLKTEFITVLNLDLPKVAEGDND